MRDTDTLLKAAVNRIAARISGRLIDSAQGLSEIADEIPQKLKEEWVNFKDEVIKESERLELQKKKETSSEKTTTTKTSDEEDLIQGQIDDLRSKVIEINKNIEEKN